MKLKIDSCHTAESKPVKQEVNGTVIRPPLVFPGRFHSFHPGLIFVGIAGNLLLDRCSVTSFTLVGSNLGHKY